ncbi:MAG: hypothetical protein ABIT83_24265 [Massilia sp.]
MARINGAGRFMWKTTIERRGGLDNHEDIITFPLKARHEKAIL